VVVEAPLLGVEPEWAAVRVVAWAAEAGAALLLGAEPEWAAARAAAWAEELVVVEKARAVGTRIAPEARWASPSGPETPCLAHSAKRLPLPAGSARTAVGSRRERSLLPGWA